MLLLQLQAYSEAGLDVPGDADTGVQVTTTGFYDVSAGGCSAAATVRVSMLGGSGLGHQQTQCS